MGRSQALCRLKRTAPHVQLSELHCRETGANRLCFAGLMTCKSPLCPLCVSAIARVRTEEISKAITTWGAERVYFATFTIRHNKHMNLALQQRLQTNAFGRMFSGRAGQELSRELGGPIVRTPAPLGLPAGEPGEPRAQKPYSVRAHDRTWSDRHNWHPHLHVLLFMHEAIPEDRVLELLLVRWKLCVAKALRAMKKVVQGAMCTGLPLDDPAYREPTDKLRSRCEKTLGKKLFKASRSLLENARPVAKALEAFSADSIVPLDRHAVVVERVRSPGRAAQYLAKLGLELSGMGTKVGKVVTEHGVQVEHFGIWQLAGVACTHGHPLRQRARAAWSDLFYATFGTQTLTFSQGARKAFGLDDRPDEAIEQEAPTVLEEQRFLAFIDGATWSRVSKQQRHGLLATLYNAHQLGVLQALPYVSFGDMPATAFMGRGVERRTEAPATPEAVLEARGRARAWVPPPVPPEKDRSPGWQEIERWERESLREDLRLRLHEEGVTRAKATGPPSIGPPEIGENEHGSDPIADCA